jgi:hypothetical protein
MLFTRSPNSLRKKRINSARKDCIISINYQDIRQSFINRKRGRDFRKKLSIRAATRILGIVLHPEPED